MSHGLTLGCLICATLWLQKKPYFVVGREFYIMVLAFVLELATTWSFSTVPTTEKLLNAFSHTLNVEHVQVCCTYNTTRYYIATAVCRFKQFVLCQLGGRLGEVCFSCVSNSSFWSSRSYLERQKSIDNSIFKQ